MAFEKSLDLIRLAVMAAARHKGVNLVDVVEVPRDKQGEFGVSQRTALRMIRGLEMAFPGVVWSTDRERRRWWKLCGTTSCACRVGVLSCPSRTGRAENHVRKAIAVRGSFAASTSTPPQQLSVVKRL
ncbi:hypothetical protein ABIE58_002206 [Roseovarius sp. MBR-78]|uniref:hypothetical protein n=1 Tax=Roseovarius sp. MBR-78 TaxID=3156460 RepID=UPI0033946F12